MSVYKEKGTEPQKRHCFWRGLISEWAVALLVLDSGGACGGVRESLIKSQETEAAETTHKQMSGQIPPPTPEIWSRWDMVVEQKMLLSVSKSELKNMEDNEDQAKDQRFELWFAKKEVA